MDHRLYFVLGDIATNILVGTLIGALAALIVGPGWNMIVAMLVLMFLGMLIAGILSLVIGILFGAMEVMVPVMLTGMVSGMVVGMWAAMAPLSTTSAALIGAVCGFVSIVGVWVVNNTVRGITTFESLGEPHD
jgi:hypothetical protein